MILVYFTVGSTSSGSAFVIVPKSWRQNYLLVNLTLKMTPALNFLIWFSDGISHTFVLFKDVTLT